jgi:transcriptional regulator with XRE-family HTH domain
MGKKITIGTQIKESRQGHGLSQVELANKCRLHIRTVQRIENNEVDPRLYTLRIIGEALDIDLVSGEDVNAEQEELKRIRRVFKHRRKIRLFTVFFTFFLLFSALALLFSGIPKMTWAPFIYIFFFIDLVVIGLTWRCPGCNSLLGDVFNVRYCSKCGLKFYEED